MTAAPVSEMAMVCVLCEATIRREPLCFVCDCGPSFALRTIAIDELMGVAWYAPELPEEQ